MRYIAVNDGVDTLNKSAMDITPFRNILNEMYSADVSVKIKSAYRARFQQGKFMGTYAPYGYIKDPADHNHLLIDDKVAHVVREIFDLALAGNGLGKIRKHINSQHVLRPAAYAAEQGATGYERYFEDNEENRYIWSENSLRNILRSPIYAGNLAGYKAKAMEKERKKLNKRLAELDRLFSSLYEDKVMERITERNFEMMSGKYQKEQLEIEARLKEVTETINESYEKSQGIRDFLSLIRNYQSLKELDATVINALIDKILVSEREKSADGTVKQEIKIYYKFIGFVGELHITPTKRWTALKPKNCTVCGVEYVPRSAISKYCPECRGKIRKAQGTETKRRSRERNRQVCIELSAKNDRLSATRKDACGARTM